MSTTIPKKATRLLRGWKYHSFYRVAISGHSPRWSTEGSCIVPPHRRMAVSCGCKPQLSVHRKCGQHPDVIRANRRPVRPLYISVWPRHARSELDAASVCVRVVDDVPSDGLAVCSNYGRCFWKVCIPVRKWQVKTTSRLSHTRYMQFIYLWRILRILREQWVR